jgi:protein-S-isoprenylcysteine O-methyltransferase Ste14
VPKTLRRLLLSAAMLELAGILDGAEIAGIALRQWAIHTLGQFFVGPVQVQSAQTVISTGPYRWLRHPPTPASGWK